MQVRTYCKRQFVSATCVCTSVKRDCTSPPMPALSPRSNSFWQAAIRNACSDRKPRPLTAARTLSPRSSEGYRKVLEKPFSSHTTRRLPEPSLAFYLPAPARNIFLNKRASRDG